MSKGPGLVHTHVAQAVVRAAASLEPGKKAESCIATVARMLAEGTLPVAPGNGGLPVIAQLAKEGKIPDTTAAGKIARAVAEVIQGEQPTFKR